jgi:hypothetical protein
MSNDQTQIRIERELRKQGYQYVRKNQTKKEARIFRSATTKHTLTKFDLALSLAACLADPAIVLQGKEGLFGDKYYDKLFPKQDKKTGQAVNYGDRTILSDLLAKYWLTRLVRSACRGKRDVAYAQWFVAHDIWQLVGSKLSNSQKARLVNLSANRIAIVALTKAIDSAFREAIAFYTRNKKEDGLIIDRASFFKRLGRYRDLEAERKSGAAGKYDFHKAHNNVARDIDSME